MITSRRSVRFCSRTEPPPAITNTRLAATSHATARDLAGTSRVGTIARYDGICRTTRSTSIAGMNTAADLTVRRTLRSSVQSSQLAMCASTCALAPASSLPCSRSGSSSLMSSLVHLFISQKLLYRLDRVVVVNPGSPFCAPYDHRDLLVRQTFLHPQNEYLSLRRRQR